MEEDPVISEEFGLISASPQNQNKRKAMAQIQAVETGLTTGYFHL